MTFLVEFIIVVITIMTEGAPLKKLEIFFDFLSPFSYLAIKEFSLLQNKISCEVAQIIWRPVLMANLIHAYETKGPAEITSKRDYLFRQILRYCARTRTPICVPKVLPFNSSEALRICLHFASKGVNISPLVESLFYAAWAEGRDLSDLEVLRGVLEHCDLDAAEAFSQSGTREVRRQLKDNHARALELGVFGVPSFVYEGELFWGRDSLVDLEDVILNHSDLPLKEIYDDYLSRFKA